MEARSGAPAVPPQCSRRAAGPPSVPPSHSRNRGKVTRGHSRKQGRATQGHSRTLKEPRHGHSRTLKEPRQLISHCKTLRLRGNVGFTLQRRCSCPEHAVFCPGNDDFARRQWFLHCEDAYFLPGTLFLRRDNNDFARRRMFYAAKTLICAPGKTFDAAKTPVVPKHSHCGTGSAGFARKR